MPGILARSEGPNKPVDMAEEEEEKVSSGSQHHKVAVVGKELLPNVDVSLSPTSISSLVEEEEEEEGKESSLSDSEGNSNMSGGASDPGVTPGGEGEKEGEGSAGGGESETKPSADSVVYNIHLSLPGVTQTVDVVLTSRDTVHDLLQFALERPECCYRTALSVHHKGKRLDDFFEIGSVEGFQDGDTVDIIEESYTQRDVRLHVQRLKDLLSTNPLQQSMLSSDGLSLSFLSSIALLDTDEIRCVGVGDDIMKSDPPSSVWPHDSLPEDCGSSPPPITSSTTTTTLLSLFYPPNLDKHFRFPECLKSLSYSSWNPPPSKRKMKGDLLYLELTILEGQDYFITATPSGFFLNKSTSRDNFDPTPRKMPRLHRHLVGLLSQISPLFKKNFAQLQKFGESLHALEILPVPYPVVPWVAPKPEHTPINFRIDDSMSLRPLPDELVVGQMRDWNEEIQSAREFPKDTSAAKVFRDRALFKIHSDFVQVCTRGAMAVVDGYLPPLNPGDEPKYRMYMWNNIFFSYAFDGRDHYKKFGGDNAARAAATADLQGVTTFEKLEIKGLYTLGTVMVDYRGYTVICQTIIPGLLQREQDSAVVYGSIDTGKNVCSEEKFDELLKKAADELHIREHSVRTEKGEIVNLQSSLEVKGIIGNDNRYYALDLFRIFPPDANYMEVAEGAKCRHKLAILRPEFIDTFLSFKFMLFLRLIKEKAEHLKTEQNKKQTTPTDASATTPITANTPDNDGAGQDERSFPLKPSLSGPRSALAAFASNSATSVQSPRAMKEEVAPPPCGDELFLLDPRVLSEKKEVGPDIPCGLVDEDLAIKSANDGEPLSKPLKDAEVDADKLESASVFREALEEAGSSSLDEFMIRFNVDILSPCVDHADDESVLERDGTLVKDAGTFLVESVIPRFIRDCIQLTLTPTDGETLTMALHARGINMRYLGRVASLASLRKDLHHIKCLCLSEMIVRLAKRRFRRLLQETPLDMTSEAISHFLNCFLSETKEELQQPTANGHARKKKNKKKGGRGTKAPPHLKMSPEDLWEEMVEEVKWYYKYPMEYSSLTDMCGGDAIQKISLLRGFCKKTGVQVVLRDYNFKATPIFTDDDINAVYPIVKHADFRPSEPVALYELALSKFSAGQLQLAHELFANTVQMFIQVYGPMQADIANCYRHMARIEYLSNDFPGALGNQHKATLIFERVLGVDNSETVSAYINLALYHHANNQTAPALRLLYRARYLLLLLFGEDHPEVATCDSNIAIILHSMGDYRNSHLFLLSTLKIHNKYHGNESLQAALTHHLLARAKSFLGDFRAALSHEKLTFTIYNHKLGGEHEKTRESSLCLKELTEKAVTMQKTINEMTGKGFSGKIQVELPGSWGEVAGMMLNGTEQLKPKGNAKKKKAKRTKASSSSPTTSGPN